MPETVNFLTQKRLIAPNMRMVGGGYYRYDKLHGRQMYRQMRGGGIGDWLKTAANWFSGLWKKGKEVYDVVAPVVKDINDTGIIQKVVDIGKDVISKKDDVFKAIKTGDVSGLANNVSDIIKKNKDKVSNAITIASDIYKKNQDPLKTLITNEALKQQTKINKLAEQSIIQNENRKAEKDILKARQIEGDVKAIDPNAIVSGVPQIAENQVASGLLRRTMRKVKRHTIRKLKGAGFKRL